MPDPRHETEPGATGTTGAAGDRPLPELLAELWELVTRYVRQETVEPVKAVGRFVAFGVAGALLIGMGIVLLAVGALRALQEETDTALTGSLTWVPYAVATVVLAVGGAVALGAIGRRRSGAGGGKGEPR